MSNRDEAPGLCSKCGQRWAFFGSNRKWCIVCESEAERHEYRPSSDLVGSPCAFCRMRPDDHDDFAREALSPNSETTNGS